MIISDFHVTNSKRHISALTLVVSGALDIHHSTCFNSVSLYPTISGIPHVPPMSLFAPFPHLEAHTSWQKKFFKYWNHLR